MSKIAVKWLNCMYHIAINDWKIYITRATNLFHPLLIKLVNPNYELSLLSDKIDWKYFEDEFSGLYSTTGKLAMPIRLMVGTLMLKRIYNLGDKTLCGAWVRDPYMLYFYGRAHFEYKFPCDPSDFVHFRKRLGEAGIEKIFTYSALLQGKAVKEKTAQSDITVAENDTTFPTDAKLAKKIIKNAIVLLKKKG